MDPAPPERMDAAALFRRWASFVARLLARSGVRPADLDDTVQEVFLTVHRRGGFTPDRASEKTWLAEIAVRVASNHRRSARRRRIDDAEQAIASAPSLGPDPSRNAEVRESIERVARALDALPTAQRVVFVLCEIEGDSCEAIARGLGVPVGTVHSRLYVARRAFHATYAANEAADASESDTDDTNEGPARFAVPTLARVAR